MKIESFVDHARPYFSVQRIHGKAPDHLPEGEKSKGMLENILRWEDDGGKIMETDHAALDQKRKIPNA